VRFRCHARGKEFNERSGGLPNRAQYPSDVIALVALWRLCYKLSLGDLAEMLLVRGIVLSHEAVRDWEAKLTLALADDLRRRRRFGIVQSCYVDETYGKARVCRNFCVRIALGDLDYVVTGRRTIGLNLHQPKNQPNNTPPVDLQSDRSCRFQDHPLSFWTLPLYMLHDLFSQPRPFVAADCLHGSGI